jgi:hypothetical protein
LCHEGSRCDPKQRKKIWATQDVIRGVVTDNRKVQSKSDSLRIYQFLKRKSSHVYCGSRVTFYFRVWLDLKRFSGSGSKESLESGLSREARRLPKLFCNVGVGSRIGS